MEEKEPTTPPVNKRHKTWYEEPQPKIEKKETYRPQEGAKMVIPKLPPKEHREVVRERVP